MLYREEFILTVLCKKLCNTRGQIKKKFILMVLCKKLKMIRLRLEQHFILSLGWSSVWKVKRSKQMFFDSKKNRPFSGLSWKYRLRHSVNYYSREQNKTFFLKKKSHAHWGPCRWHWSGQSSRPPRVLRGPINHHLATSERGSARARLQSGLAGAPGILPLHRAVTSELADRDRDGYLALRGWCECLSVSETRTR